MSMFDERDVYTEPERSHDSARKDKANLLNGAEYVQISIQEINERTDRNYRAGIWTGLLMGAVIMTCVFLTILAGGRAASPKSQDRVSMIEKNWMSRHD